MGMMDDVLADDAVWQNDADEMAEAITYHPHGGDDQSMSGIVFRNPSKHLQGPTRLRRIIVAIPRAAAPDGRPTINVTVDKISLYERRGAAAVTKLTVQDVVKQTMRRWYLAVG